MKRSALVLSAFVCLLADSLPCQAQADPLPQHAYKRFGTTRLRHGGPIQCLAFSPDDNFIAAGGGNDAVRLWSIGERRWSDKIETGAEWRRFKEHWVSTLAFSSRGGILATAGAFKKIRLWDTTNDAEIAVLEGHQSSITTLIYSPNGAMLASGCQDGTVMLWKPNMTKPVETFAGHTDEVNALAFSPDSTRLTSAGLDGTILVRSIDGKVNLSKFGTGCGVNGLVFSGDGKILISAGDDKVIRLWDAESGKALEVLKGHEDAVTSLLLSRNGKILVSAGLDSTIRLWDLAAKKPWRIIPRNDDGAALALSSDGKLLAYAGHHNTIHLVETATGKELFPDLGSTAPIVGLGLSKDGKKLVSAGSDHVLRQWDVQTAKQLASHAAFPTGDLSVPCPGRAPGNRQGQESRHHPFQRSSPGRHGPHRWNVVCHRFTIRVSVADTSSTYC